MAKRGRPPGSGNKKKGDKPEEVPSAPTPAPGHNSGRTIEALSDDQQQALFLQHKKKYKDALGVKKEAAADFLNICKIAKADLGEHAVADIKEAILLETEEGEAQMKARIERHLRIARWMALPLGTQADFVIGTDLRPLDERAEAEGKKAGMEGERCSPPYHGDAEQAWLRGWHDGQAVLVAKNIKKPEPDGGDFDDAIENEKGEEGAAPTKFGIGASAAGDEFLAKQVNEMPDMPDNLKRTKETLNA